MAQHAAVMGAPSSRATASRLAAVMAACALAMAALLASRAADWARRDWHALWLQDRVAEWAGAHKPYTEAEWFEAQAELRRAERIMPNDAGLQDTLGVLHMVRGYQLWSDVTARTPYLEQALRHFERSVALRPHVAQGWANVALARYLTRRPIEETAAAWRKAVALGPKEDDVMRLMLNVVLGSWEEAPQEMREWLTGLREEAASQIKGDIEQWARYYGVSLPPLTQ